MPSMRIVLQLPQVERKKLSRPSKCPYCKGEVFQRWGTGSRQIKDTKVRTVKVSRYKCTGCRRTFRAYSQGVSHAQQSKRLMKLCVIMWSLGLSHRSVVLILSVFGISLSHMSGWRDVQEEGKRIRHKMRWKTTRVAGVDGAWLNGKSVHVSSVTTIDQSLIATGFPYTNFRYLSEFIETNLTWSISIDA